MDIQLISEFINIPHNPICNSNSSCGDITRISKVMGNATEFSIVEKRIGHLLFLAVQYKNKSHQFL